MIFILDDTTVYTEFRNVTKEKATNNLCITSLSYEHEYDILRIVRKVTEYKEYK